MAAAGDLFDKRVILVLGKGGVGRTAVTAALGRALARRGRKTLLFQANAKDKLAKLLGTRPIGEAITQIGAADGGAPDGAAGRGGDARLRGAQSIDERLFALNTNANAALHEYGLMVLKYETVYRLVMENQVAKKLVRAIPGLDDYAIIGKMWFHTTEEVAGGRPKWDTVVFDAPATGHAITMFKIPRAILDAVPAGPLTRDAVKVRELFEDPRRTAAVIVTLAEEMPTNEALELAAKVRELGISVSHLIVNQLYPDRVFKSGTPARVLDALIGAGAAADDPALASLVSASRTMRTRRQLNERYLARLEELRAPQVRLPMLFVPTLGPAEIDELSRLIEEQLGGGLDYIRAGEERTR